MGRWVTNPVRDRCLAFGVGVGVAVVVALSSTDPSVLCAGEPGVFFEGDVYPLGTPGNVMLARDLNADGRPDVIISHEASGIVSFVLADASTGGFTAPQSLPAGLSPVSLASGDIDGNGFEDALAVNTGSGMVSVYLNEGTGSFRAGTPILLSGIEVRVARLADFDADGDLDIAVSNLSSYTIDILLGDGEGGFTPKQSLSFTAEPHSVVLADFDGDGRVDLAAPIYGWGDPEGHVFFYPGRGDGSFSAAIPVVIGRQLLRYTASGDFDSDGRPDFCVFDFDGRFYVMRSRGDWQFETDEYPPTPGDTIADMNTWHSFLQAVDVDGDGDLDLVTRNLRKLEGGFRIYRNDGLGKFGAPRDFTVGNDMGSAIVADFDGDGYSDVLTTRSSPDLVLLRGNASGTYPLKETVGLPAIPRGLAGLRSLGGALGLVASGLSGLHWIGYDSHLGFRVERTVEFPTRAFQTLSVGDFDGAPGEEPALVDIAANTVFIYFRAEGESPARWVEQAIDGVAVGLAAAKLDGDAAWDVVVAHQDRNTLTAIFAPALDGAETRRVTLDAGAPQSALTVADVSGDGHADILTATSTAGLIFPGDGNGAFGAALPVGSLAGALALETADLDGDGTSDACAIFPFLLRVAFDVFESPNAAALEIPLEFSARSLAAADLDEDGILDLVLAAESLSSVAVLLGMPARGFSSPRFYATGSFPRGLVASDFDGDGRLDVATADQGSRSVSILRGRAPQGSFRRGDVDLDGRVNITDAVRILGALFLGTGPIACADSADTNDDGRINITDAVRVLDYLFRGGDTPPSPGPAVCGSDPSIDGLDPCGEACGPR